MNDTTAPTTARTFTLAGWMGRQATVTVEGGTLAEARREAKRLAARQPQMLPGRLFVLSMEVS